MAKLVKEVSFFGGNRRQSTLDSWQVLQSRAGEKHLKLALQIPLSDQNLVAMPQWVANQFEAMQKDESATRRAVLDRFCEGMTLEVFSTEKNRTRALSLTGVTLKNMHLTRDGEEEDADVTLHVTVYSPANVQARDWAWDHLRGTFWAAFEYSQTEMEFGNADSETEESDDPDFAGENANTMDASRDAEFATPATKRGRGAGRLTTN